MDLIKREDFALTPTEAIALTKELKGLSSPSANKAHYSNTNAISLGLIIEEKTRMPLEQAMEKYVFSPLGLTRTKLISQGQHVVPFYIGDKPTSRVTYTSSALAPGGLVSTSEEVAIFMQAFFSGKLFNQNTSSSHNFGQSSSSPSNMGPA